MTVHAAAAAHSAKSTTAPARSTASARGTGFASVLSKVTGTGANTAKSAHAVTGFGSASVFTHGITATTAEKLASKKA